MNIICLDTEFTGIAKFNEILQLAILNQNGEILLNELYKPEKAKKWPFSQKVHNISPDMVADKPHFKDKLPEIQAMFDAADLIVGFALDNDLRELEISNVQGLEPERCFDVRYLYWAVLGEENNVGIYNVPSLVKCSTDCGFDWTTATAHAAEADALATNFLYNKLMEAFAKKYDILPDAGQDWLGDSHIKKLVSTLKEMVDQETQRVAEENAKGYLYLFFKEGSGYQLVNRREPLEQEQLDSKAQHGKKLVEFLQVNDRWKAQFDFVKKFERRSVKGCGMSAVWMLKEGDITFFKRYENEFTGNSRMFKSLLENYNRFK